MEEPLGSRFSSFIKLALCFSLISGSLHAADDTCARLLRDRISNTIEHVSESRPENTDNARRVLHGLADEIEKRVRASCPEPSSCSEDQLNDTILRITHDVLDENPVKTVRWRSKLIFVASLSLYLGLSVWVTMNTNSMTAAAASSLLTVLGAMVLIKVGGPNLEGPLAKLGRKTVAADGGREDLQRGRRQERHEQLYWSTQESVDTVEEMGRYTERQVVLQICNAKNACAPHPWDTPETYRERAAYLLAKLLSDLIPSYLEIDFSEPFYSTWFRTLFSEWHLDEESRAIFRVRVLELIEGYYDAEAKLGKSRREKYERALRSWTAPLQPLIVPLGNRQSRIERPSRTEANPLFA